MRLKWALGLLSALAGCSGSSPNGSAMTWLLAAGDIAICGTNSAAESTAAGTAKLLTAHPNAAVITLGDNAYDNGTIDE